MAPASSAILKKLVENYLDTNCFAVIEGGVEIAAKICDYTWDMICFTGSTQKGKLVAAAAAKNLIPCVLELGGKCPAVVDTSADLDFTACKIAWARFQNSGQTCLAVDYVFVHESIKDKLIERIIYHTRTFFGEHPTGSDDMGKVVTGWHCDRLKDMIDNSKGIIKIGGKVNKDAKYVEPTIILNPDSNSAVLKEEIFGPILPILTFKYIQEPIDYINERDKPLCVYYFGKMYNNDNKERLLNETSSGTFMVNEVLLNIINHSFGFGGVGASGYGRYGGYEGFKAFSNPKSVMNKPALNIYPWT